MTIDQPDDWGNPPAEEPPWASEEFTPDEPDVQLLEHLRSVLAEVVTQRELDILGRRVGLSGSGGETLQDIADDYGLSRERIRQIQARALARVTRRMRRNGLVDGSTESQLDALIYNRLRRLRRPDRGTFLRTSFPGANPPVLDQLLVRCCRRLRVGLVGAWLEEYEANSQREQLQAANEQRIRAKADRLLSAVIWLGDGAAVPVPVAPCRQVRDEGGSFYSDKLNRTVCFDSGEEARVLQILDEAPQVTSYCEQPLAVKYRWFDGVHRYIPDIAVELQDGGRFLIEVKPQTLWAEGRNLAKWNAATHWCMEHNWGFAVVDGSARSPQQILVSPTGDRARILENLTISGPANYGDLQPAWFENGWTWSMLIATALSNGFALERSPLRVTRARHSRWLAALRAATE